MIKNAVIQLDPHTAEKACREIASSLPEWFGIPEANERYAQGVRERLSLGYSVDGSCLGLLSLESPFAGSAIIYWMGVKKEAHGQGIGRALLRHAERLCLQKNIFTISVETLSPQEKNAPYLKTFDFYSKEGFSPLFELNTYGNDYLMVYLSKTLSPKIFTWIDLTHTLNDRIPTWEGSCGFKHWDIQPYDESETDCKFRVERIDMLAGVGTHIDAPAHCFQEGKTVGEIPLSSLIAPCLVIDVSQDVHPLYTVEMNAIELFENTYGEISKGSFVLFFTGWEFFWNDPAKYHNNLQFPCISREVAEYLVTKDVAGIGIDTLSPDRGDSGFPVHQALLGAGKFIVENVANAEKMPPIGGTVCIMPIKINGAEAPIRLLGIL